MIVTGSKCRLGIASRGLKHPHLILLPCVLHGRLRHSGAIHV